MNKTVDFWMTDLEERLASSEGAIAQASICQTLADAGKRISLHMSQGLPPVQYEKCLAVHQALAAAHEIIALFPIETSE